MISQRQSNSIGQSQMSGEDSPTQPNAIMEQPLQFGSKNKRQSSLSNRRSLPGNFTAQNRSFGLESKQELLAGKAPKEANSGNNASFQDASVIDLSRSSNQFQQNDRRSKVSWANKIIQEYDPHKREVRFEDTRLPN